MNKSRVLTEEERKELCREAEETAKYAHERYGRLKYGQEESEDLDRD